MNFTLNCKMIERVHFKEISSTNDYAKELIKSKELIAISADYQIKGRGRNNKTWEGNYGENIYISFAINHNYLRVYDYPSRYQALGCLVVYFALSKFLNFKHIRIKYPNDIYIFDQIWKKISGVLIEHSSSGKKAENTIIGIGVNINQKEFPNSLTNPASSLYNIGINIEIEKVYEELLNIFEELLSKTEDEIFSIWVTKLNLYAKNIQLSSDNTTWKLQKINQDCSLNLISFKGETRRIDNGDSIRYEL